MREQITFNLDAGEAATLRAMAARERVPVAQIARRVVEAGLRALAGEPKPPALSPAVDEVGL